jgi:signal transduction histidine kinase
MSGLSFSSSIRNILLLSIGTLSLLVGIFTMLQVWQEWRHLSRIQALHSATLVGDVLFETAERLSVERDIAFLMLHTHDPSALANMSEDLKENRQAIEKNLPATLHAMEKYHFPDLDKQLQDTSMRLAHLDELRRTVDQKIRQAPRGHDSRFSQRWFDDTTVVINDIRSLWIDFISRFNDVDPRVLLHIRFKFFLGSITEYAGQERSLIGRLIVENARPTPEEQASLLRWQGVMDLCWTVDKQLAEQGALFPALKPLFKDAQSHYLNLYDMTHDLFYVPGQKISLPYPISAPTWLELASETSDSLYALKDGALQESQRYVESLEKEAQGAIAITLAVLFLSLSLCLYSFRLITRRVLNPIQVMIQALLDTAQGRNVAPLPDLVAREDEVGKLAQVLGSFQQTMDNLTRYTKDLERSNKELDDFAYIASHDLKEPLRGISTHSHFLQEDNKGKLDAESVNHLNRLVFLSQRIERLINDLLYYSRLGRQQLAIGPTDINLIIQDIKSTIDVFLEQNHAQVVAATPLPVIVCDKVRVTEAFRNLIVNAVKYNDSPTKKVEIGFLETYIANGGKVYRNVFYVKDNGHGIPPEFHEEIFRIFKRLEASPKSAEAGTGVGLTFVKKIIERHGGKIWLESTPGSGTTFYFTLQEENGQQSAGKAVA